MADPTEIDDPAGDSPAQSVAARPKPPPMLMELPPIGWKDVLCVGPLTVMNLWRLFSATLTGPLIGTNPVLLSALRGSFTSMIAAGALVKLGTIPLWLAVLAPIPILMFDDPFVYWGGMRYGRPLLNHLIGQNPRMGRQLPRAERVFRRFSALAIIVANLPVNPLPMTFIVMFLAGETRMRFAWFLLVDFVSLLIFTGFYVGIGYLLGKSANDVAVRISHFGLPIFLLTLAIIILATVRSFRRSMRQMREQMAAYDAGGSDDELPPAVSGTT